VHTDELYGDKYRWDRCGPLSAACQQYFVDEACTYECDVNAGKWRLHGQTNSSECNDSNGWQISNMPIKASFANAWYEACKDDLFAATESGSYFDVALVEDVSSQCSTFSTIYSDGADMLHRMWAGAFIYDTNEEHAYTMHFEVGEENPNDSVLPEKGFPAQCDFHAEYFDTDIHSQCPEVVEEDSAAFGLAGPFLAGAAAAYAAN